MHGFDFTLSRREPLQCTDTQQDLFLPRRPEADLRGAQSGGIEGVIAPARRFGACSGQVQIEKSEDARIVKTAGDDDHG
jgi:hypothetical protein